LNSVRSLLATTTMTAVLSFSAHAQGPGGGAGTAQAWPAKPVRLVLGLPPGSGSDLLARALAQRLTGQWGQTVIVENRPGANTIIATEFVARATPDAHTLLFGIGYSFTLLPHMYEKIPYDPVADFAPITLLADFGTVLVVNSSLRAGNLAELIALARSQPGKISYGSIGSGSSPHLMWEMINHKAGVKLLHVPYKGQSQLITAVITNEVNATWAGVFTVRPHVASGKVRALAYSAAKRSSAMPELPTILEAGYPDARTEVWYGLFAPARTPRSLVNRIHSDVGALLADREFRDKEIFSKGYEPGGLGPDELAALIRRDLQAGAELVKISGARAE